jgi:hypothetical protein
MVLAESPVRGRNSFEFARRGRLAERGLGGVGFADDGELWSVMTADIPSDSSVCLDRVETRYSGKLFLPNRMWYCDWSRLGSYRAADDGFCRNAVAI